MRIFFKMVYYDWTICHVSASRDALLSKGFNIYNLKYVMHGVSMWTIISIEWYLVY